nr:hypothetical protein [uncultured Carboxylicivirga sp.]
MNPKTFTANKIFTDREPYKKSLNDSLDRLLSNGDKEFLYFYGAGGQGKSAICKEFINEILPKRNDLEYVLTDFQASEHREMPEILENMREGLGRKLKAKFTAFDITFLKYKTIINNSEYVRSKYSYMFTFENDIANNVIDFANECVSEVPGLRVLFNVAKHFGQKYYESHLEKTEEFLKYIKIDSLTSIELEKMLPLAFAHDLNRIMKSRTKKVVIIFDTYEQLWKDKSKRKSTSASQVDSWIKQLFDDIDNDTLIVGFGRDKLIWPEEDEKYDFSINQHRLGKLSKEDCDSYLNNIPIVEKSVREKIIKTSEGLPYYLDLQVNTYEQLKNSDKPISVDQFGDNPKEIHARFVEHIGHEAERRLTYAAIPRVVNKKIIRLLVSNGFFERTPQLFESIVSESYFDQINNTEEYALHSLLRSHLINEIKKSDEDEYLELNEILANYYQSIVDDLISESNYGELLEVASKELIYHLSICETKSAFKFIKKIFESDIVVKSQNLNLALDLCEVFSDSIESEDEKINSVVNYYILVIENKLSNHTRVIKLYDTYFKDVISDWSKNAKIIDENKEIDYGMIGFKYCDALYEKGYYKKLNEFIIFHYDWNYGLLIPDLNAEVGKKSLAFAQLLNQMSSYNEKTNDDEKIRNFYNGVYYNRLGNYFTNLNLHNCALDVYKNSYQLISDDNSPEDRAIVLRQLGSSKLSLGDSSGLNDLKKGLSFLTENNLKNHVFYYVISLDIIIYEIKHKSTLEVSSDVRDSILNFIELISNNTERVINGYVLDIIETIESNKSAAIVNYFQYLRTMYGNYSYQLVGFLKKAKEYNIDLGFDISKRIKDIVSLSEYNVRTEGLPLVPGNDFRYQSLFKTVSSNIIGFNSDDCKDVKFYDLPFWDGDIYLAQISFEDFTLFAIIDHDKWIFPDGSNSAFYQLSERCYNGTNIKLYVRMFFDFTSGKHGRFIITESTEDLYWSSNYNGHQIPEHITIKPLEIIEKKDGLTKLQTGSLIFKDSFFSSEIHVTNNGLISLTNESILWEECGFRFETEMPEKQEGNARNLLRFLETEETFPGLKVEIDILQDIMVKANTITCQDFIDNECELVKETSIDDSTGKLYRLSFYNDKYILLKKNKLSSSYDLYINDSDKKFHLLDGTNELIYQISDSLIFDEENCRKYIRFFFSVVSGRHGHFILVDNVSSKYINVEYEDNVEINPEEMELIESSDNEMVFRCKTILFKDSAFIANIHVTRKGQISLSNEELIEESCELVNVIHEKREKIMIEFSRQLNKIKHLTDTVNSNDVITPFLVKQLLKKFESFSHSI